MSVRIHQLSKEIGIENKELIQLLVERGFEVKSASSTIDNISAESLREEFAQKKSSSEQKAAASEVVQAAKPKLPLGALVKSAQDVSNERA
jgi:translation initiation factor IF-2